MEWNEDENIYTCENYMVKDYGYKAMCYKLIGKRYAFLCKRNSLETALNFCENDREKEMDAQGDLCDG